MDQAVLFFLVALSYFSIVNSLCKPWRCTDHKQYQNSDKCIFNGKNEFGEDETLINSWWKNKDKSCYLVDFLILMDQKEISQTYQQKNLIHRKDFSEQYLGNVIKYYLCKYENPQKWKEALQCHKYCVEDQCSVANIQKEQNNLRKETKQFFDLCSYNYECKSQFCDCVPQAIPNNTFLQGRCRASVFDDVYKNLLDFVCLEEIDEENLWMNTACNYSIAYQYGHFLQQIQFLKQDNELVCIQNFVDHSALTQYYPSIIPSYISWLVIALIVSPFVCIILLFLRKVYKTTCSRKAAYEEALKGAYSGINQEESTVFKNMNYNYD